MVHALSELSCIGDLRRPVARIDAQEHRVGAIRKPQETW
jgi:hypothetical protein